MMTAQNLAHRYEIEETVLDRCAALAGIGKLEEYDEEQQLRISFAIMLDKFGFREDRIRMCCADPRQFPEMIRQEQAECSSKTRSEELNGMLSYVDDDWSGTLGEVDEVVMCMEFQLETAGGVAFGPYPWMAMLIILVISMAVALLLKPHIQAILNRLLSGPLT